MSTYATMQLPDIPQEFAPLPVRASGVPQSFGTASLARARLFDAPGSHCTVPELENTSRGRHMARVPQQKAMPDISCVEHVSAVDPNPTRERRRSSGRERRSSTTKRGISKIRLKYLTRPAHSLQILGRSCGVTAKRAHRKLLGYPPRLNFSCDKVALSACRIGCSQHEAEAAS